MNPPLRVFLAYTGIGAATVLAFWLLLGPAPPAQLLLGLAASTTTAGVLAVAEARPLARRLMSVQSAAERLAAGDFAARTGAGAGGQTEALGRAVDRIGVRLETGLAAARRARDNLSAVLEGLDDAVALVDAEGRVQARNTALETLAGRPAPRGSQLSVIFRDPSIPEAAERAAAGEPVSRETSVGERTVLVRAVHHDGGALLLLRDLTDRRLLEQMRRDFVANVSHEMKTPLTSVVGFAEAISDPNLGAGLSSEFAERILVNATRMRRLVDDLLELSHVESGSWSPSVEPVAVRGVAETVWRDLPAGLAADGVTLDVDPDASDARVTADARAVRQVLRNLIENALRYAPAETAIRIRFRPLEGRAEWLRVEVSDGGPGIPSDQVDRVFERFYRVDPDRSREGGGTGLGLAIVKHLVGAHGGETGIETGVGAGTTVWFTLPGSLTPDSPPPGEPEGTGRKNTGHFRGNVRDRRDIATLAVVAALAVSAGCAALDPVWIDGSSTVRPITEAAATAFRAEHPRARLAVGTSGTTGGFVKFCEGWVDISNASRRMTGAERATCRRRGIEPVEVALARDGIAVVAHPASNWVECLSVEELRGIWEPGSAVRTWGQVRPEWPGNDLLLYGPGPDSGTFDFFTTAVMGRPGESRNDYASNPHSDALLRGVSGDAGSLGFLGRGKLQRDPGGVKTISVNAGAGCQPPSENAVVTGAYPLARTIYMYVGQASLRRPEVWNFVSFLLDGVDRFTSAAGYFALDDDAYHAQRRRLSEARRGSSQ